MNTMNITLDLKDGEVAVFTIQFKNEDFMKVVDCVDSVTLENIEKQTLFTVI